MTRLVLALSKVALGCTSPTAPSPLLEGILTYEHPQFGGSWKVLTGNVDDLEDLARDGGDWDDRVSSIRIVPPA